MNGTWTWYGHGLLGALRGDFDLVPGLALKIVIWPRASWPYTPSQAHKYRTDIPNTSYFVASVTLVSSEYDAATNTLGIFVEPPSATGWTHPFTSGFDFAVLYVDKGSRATDRLLAYTALDEVLIFDGWLELDNGYPSDPMLKITVV